MSNQNNYPLSLNGDTFNGLKTDYDSMLRTLIGEMERMDEEEATINIKVAVRLEKDQARDFKANGYDAMRDIVKPSFKHEISTVMQIKNKKNGTLGGNMELIWDRDNCQYVMRPIDNGQVSLFDENAGETPATKDANIPKGLPSPAMISGELPASKSIDDNVIDAEYTVLDDSINDSSCNPESEYGPYEDTGYDPESEYEPYENDEPYDYEEPENQVSA